MVGTAPSFIAFTIPLRGAIFPRVRSSALVAFRPHSIAPPARLELQLYANG